MQIKVKISNFGKLNKAELDFRGLTFFVGTNNIGKSYVSRVLYTMFSAAAVDPQRYYYDHLITQTRDDFQKYFVSYFKSRAEADDIAKFLAVQDKINQLLGVNLAKDISKILASHGNYPHQLLSAAAADNAVALKRQVDVSFNKWLLQAKTTLEKELAQPSKERKQNDFAARYDELINNTRNRLNRADKDAIKESYAALIRDKLIKNFQAEDIKDLVGEDKQKDATISIYSLTGSDGGGDSMYLVISSNGDIKKADVNIADPKIYSDVVYLESPLYWKLKTKLTSGSLDIYRRDEYLSEVPQYFLDVAEKLNLRKIAKNGDAKFRAELLEELEEIIGGRIYQDRNSEQLLFMELKKSGAGGDGGKKYKKGISLMLTATGIVQFAMLAYLIERRIIERGTTLFLDEPEVHLHPEWQESIMAALYRLSKHGVNVIIATHSTVIMQKMELCLAEDESIKDEDSPQDVALNYFSPDGRFAASKETFSSIRKKITKSLVAPAYRMYVKQM